MMQMVYLCTWLVMCIVCKRSVFMAVVYKPDAKSGGELAGRYLCGLVVVAITITTRVCGSSLA